MANPTQLPGDLIVPGTMRTSGGFSPTLARSAVLAQGVLQAFTVPLAAFREKTSVGMMPGTGISKGSGTICNSSVSRVGGLIKTEMFIDLTGLSSSAGDDIIGVTGETSCYIGKWVAAINGTAIHGRITCLETPATGDTDIDLYGMADAGTGAESAQDAAVSGLTDEIQLLNNGAWTGAEATPIALTTLPTAGYMYLAGPGATVGTYTAGKFLIEIWATPATAAMDYVEGTFGTDAPSLQTAEFSNNHASASYYNRGEIQVPWEYEAGESMTLRLSAGMITTVASVAASVDVEVYKSDEDATSTGDLCATDLQTVTSTTFADKDFVITPTTLSPGDLLDVRFTFAVHDDGDGGLMRGSIGSVQLLCDVR